MVKNDFTKGRGKAMLRKTTALLSALFLITLGATGCDSQSSFNHQLQNPKHLIQDGLLSLAETTNRLFLGGEVTGFGRLKRDGKIDFALVTPSLTRMDLLNFDLSTLISPQMDTISIIGNDLNIPSNIALPDQRENYSLITIRLNKPSYRSFVHNPGTHTFSALRGQFPVRQVVDDFRNDKSIFEIMNHFQFLGSGQMDVQLNTPVENQAFPVDQFTFDQQVEIAGLPLEPGKLSFAVSLADQNGKFSPVDLKNLKPDAVQPLAVAPYGNRFLLGALVNEGAEGELPQFDQMSLTLIPMEYKDQLDFLPLAKKPEFLSETTLQIYPLEMREGLIPQYVYVSFSEIQTHGEGSLKTEEKTLIWDNFYSGFPSQVEIPKLDFNKDPNKKYQYEVLYLAKDPRLVQRASTTALDEITHISRNVVVVQE
tara:strand:+ start:5165 stop:6439 length:1275 start_codon:yes stop_codon:yes gene_type:complete